MMLSMNIQGYIQDAQKDYVELLSRKDIDEIYIMAPYFSDDKIAGSLIKAADRLKDKFAKEKKDQVKSKSVSIQKKLLSKLVKKELEKEKRIHVVFPKKQENRIIEVSRYYAYYLRNNPIVETLQFNAKTDSENF